MRLDLIEVAEVAGRELPVLTGLGALVLLTEHEVDEVFVGHHVSRLSRPGLPGPLRALLLPLRGSGRQRHREGPIPNLKDSLHDRRTKAMVVVLQEVVLADLHVAVGVQLPKATVEHHSVDVLLLVDGEEGLHEIALPQLSRRDAPRARGIDAVVDPRDDRDGILLLELAVLEELQARVESQQLAHVWQEVLSLNVLLPRLLHQAEEAINEVERLNLRLPEPQKDVLVYAGALGGKLVRAVSAKRVGLERRQDALEEGHIEEARELAQHLRDVHEVVDGEPAVRLVRIKHVGHGLELQVQAVLRQPPAATPASFSLEVERREVTALPRAQRARPHAGRSFGANDYPRRCRSSQGGLRVLLPPLVGRVEIRKAACVLDLMVDLPLRGSRERQGDDALARAPAPSAVRLPLR
eukprot:scaffold2945_cov244-Pinguiococcus_pyrenoidosus.AAC.13